ncbi:MAG: I78 family peptidase inhibitor [Erythrobacter sp.]
MRILLVILPALTLAACAGYSERAEAPSDRASGRSSGLCEAEAVQEFVGRSVDDEIGETITRESGAAILRWGPPNSAWTMDYRTDRVNVRYDETMIITEITCG